MTVEWPHCSTLSVLASGSRPLPPMGRVAVTGLACMSAGDAGDARR